MTETRTSATESTGARLDLFAVAAPGLEPIVARELETLGERDAAVTSGGVSWSGDHESLYRASLHLRTASRIIVRVGQFGARGFPELVRHARRLAWERYLTRDRPVEFNVTCRKSRLYHTTAVAERVRMAIVDRLGGELPHAQPDTDAESHPLVIVRVMNDRCTLSIDSSGALLHRRGYREETAKAPIRETLAAALLLAAEWSGTSPLIDPFCGSGTIPIEAALMARRIAPGLRRAFAFMDWPDFDERRWQRLLAAAEREVLPNAAAPIQGSDRDAGAVAASRRNAERAGVDGNIELSQRALSAIEPPAGFGWVCTNPPYGARVSQDADVRNLYAQLGKVLRAKCSGWTLAMFSADPKLERATGLRLEGVVKTVNGGIPVRMVRGRVQ